MIIKINGTVYVSLSSHVKVTEIDLNVGYSENERSLVIFFDNLKGNN